MSETSLAHSVKVRPRRNGKTLEYRHAVEAAAMAGQHVHVLGRDGAWCVTWQPAGFLWARLPRGRRLGARPQLRLADSKRPYRPPSRGAGNS